MSYTPMRCSGISRKISSWCIRTFEGSHSLGGQSAISMSKPSNWVVGWRVFARSSNHILRKRKDLMLDMELGE